MKFGAHVSASGGLWNGPENAAKIGCEVFQFFSRPPQGGEGMKLTPEVVKKFREACEKFEQELWVIHAPYIINFASTTERIRNGSIRIIREELERGSALRARAVMFHPGSARDVPLSMGIRKVADGLNELMFHYKGSAQPLIEVSGGCGHVIRGTVDEVGDILKPVEGDDGGVCFHPAHPLGYGYGLAGKKTGEETFDLFDK